MNCLDITHKEFLDSANSAENYVRVNWPGRSLRPDILTRKCIIDSVDQWKDIIQVSYLPWYKNGKSPEDNSAQNFKLYECSIQISPEIRSLAEKILETAPDKRITAAYDIKLNKRLILDEDHRALAVQLKVNLGENIPEMELMECYGEHRKIFLLPILSIFLDSPITSIFYLYSIIR